MLLYDTTCYWGSIFIFETMINQQLGKTFMQDLNQLSLAHIWF